MSGWRAVVGFAIMSGWKDASGGAVLLQLTETFFLGSGGIGR